MPARQIYIFLSVFSVYHDTGDDKRPGKHLHNRICPPVLTIQDHSDHFLYLIFMYLRQLFSDAFGRSDSSFSLSEFHIALDAEVRSIQPVKFHSRAVYLRQSPQFIFRILQSQMRVGIHRYADVEWPIRYCSVFGFIPALAMFEQ